MMTMLKFVLTGFYLTSIEKKGGMQPFSTSPGSAPAYIYSNTDTWQLKKHAHGNTKTFYVTRVGNLGFRGGGGGLGGVGGGWENY